MSNQEPPKMCFHCEKKLDTVEEALTHDCSFQERFEAQSLRNLAFQLYHRVEGAKRTAHATENTGPV